MKAIADVLAQYRTRAAIAPLLLDGSFAFLREICQTTQAVPFGSFDSGYIVPVCTGACAVEIELQPAMNDTARAAISAFLMMPP